MKTRDRTIPASAAWTLLLALSAGPAPAAELCGTWSAVDVPGGDDRPLRTVSASSPTDAWAVWRGVFHWNGSNWSPVPAPGLGSPDTVFWGVAAVAQADAWIVGYTAFLGTPQTLTERWNGASWSIVPSPVIDGGSYLEAVSALSPNDAWAVGARAGGLPQFPGTSAPLTVHWNGSSWTAVPSPSVANRSHELRDVVALAPNDVWAVGSSRNITENYRSFALHWDGSAWSVVPTPNLPGENILHGVSGRASNDVWAVGFSWDGVTGRQIFLHWDGSSWTQVGNPTDCDGCTGDVLAMGPDDVWAVGSEIGHWNGSAWTVVPNPTIPGASGLVLRGLARVGSCDAWSVGGQFDDEGVESAVALRLASSSLVGVDPVGAAFALGAQPSPFRETTTIGLTLPSPAIVRLAVVDATGRRVRAFGARMLAAGRHAFRWDGRDDAGTRAPAGVYFARITAGAHSATTKLVRLD